MTILTILVITGTCFLACANGANDNFKGVATLAGSGTTDYRRALAWATVTTLAGSLLAVVLAGALLETFSGKGLVPDAVVAQPAFMAAVGLAAGTTVIIATIGGLPISTTHALTGALVGVGLAANGGQVAWSNLQAAFAVPLLCSPVVAVLLTALAYPPLRRARRALGVDSETCVCVGTGEFVPVAVGGPAAAVAPRAGGPVVVVAPAARCTDRYTGGVLGLSAAVIADRVHYLSAGAVCLARGVNDTPKIVALLLSSQAAAQLGGWSARWAFGLVAVCMAVGGLLGARKVGRTMSRDITDMNVGQGLTANLVTAFLVIVASRLGMPVSTTHVSCGALFGLGVVTRRARWKTIGTILVAWVTTLPIAAALGGLCFVFARALAPGG